MIDPRSGIALLAYHTFPYGYREPTVYSFYDIENEVEVPATLAPDLVAQAEEEITAEFLTADIKEEPSYA